jgi:hypothetical protein
METYSNETLRVLESVLKDYKLDTPCASSGLTEKYCGVKGERQWYIDNHCLKDCPDEDIIIDLPRYQERRNKLEQLRRLQQRTEYAKKKDLESQAESLTTH